MRVSSSVLDPLSLADPNGEGLPQASFSGVVSAVVDAAADGLAVGDTVFGVGPLAEVISLPASEIERLPTDAELQPQQAAAIPYLCSFFNVLGAIEAPPAGRILITGRPVIRHISEQVLKSLQPGVTATQVDLSTRRDLPNDLEAPFEVLVHGVGDPQDLQLSLSAVAMDGEAFLLVGPGEHVLPLDFYPGIHRSCLRAPVRRVGRPCSPQSCPDPGHRLLRKGLEQGQIDIASVLAHAASAGDLADLAPGISEADRLIALTWP